MNPAPRTPERTVLVVEDEERVLRFMTEALSLRGYQVLPVRNATEALKVAGDCSQIRLLVTDVVMPGMSGPELAKQLLAREPGLRVLFISGYTGDEVLGESVIQPEATFLEKPFDAGRLLRVVDEILAHDPKRVPGQ